MLHDVTDDAASGRRMSHRVTADPACTRAQSSRSGSDAEHAFTYAPVHVLPRGDILVTVEHRT
jgi:hypothetical protein